MALTPYDELETRSADARAAALAEALPHAKIMPNAPQLPRVYDAISRHLGAALTGAASPRDALAAAEGDVNRLLA